MARACGQARRSRRRWAGRQRCGEGAWGRSMRNWRYVHGSAAAAADTADVAHLTALSVLLSFKMKDIKFDGVIRGGLVLETSDSLGSTQGSFNACGAG